MIESARVLPSHWGELWAVYQRENEKARYEADRKGAYTSAVRWHERTLRLMYEQAFVNMRRGMSMRVGVPSGDKRPIMSGAASDLAPTPLLGTTPTSKRLEQHP